MMLSILSMALTGLIFQEIKFSSAISRLSLSLPMAKAAVRRVFYDREADDTEDYDTMQELTKENSAILCDKNSYKYYYADKKPGVDSEEIIDEGALININLASLDVLKRLPGIDEDLAEGIMNSGLRPYAAINELLLVEDMTKEKFMLIKDMITVYGNGKVNINTASRGVLLCLGLDEELVDVIMDFRKVNKIEKKEDSEETSEEEEEEEEDAIEAEEEEDYGFSSLSSMINSLRDFASLSLRQEQDLISLQNSLSVKSEYLRFNIIPQINNKPGTHYSIIIDPSKKKLLSWREY